MERIAARLTREMIADVLNYNPETGVFTWRKPGKNRVADRVAGTITFWGYRVIHVQGKLTRASHLAWVLTYGVAPMSEADHIDRDRANDAISNLRLATTRQNIANSGLRSTNTSGHKGIYWCTQARKWKARIRDHGKHKHLGAYDDPAEAGAAYAKAAREMYGEFAAGIV